MRVVQTGVFPNPAEDGFPIEKVNHACDFLIAIKPWWSRFLSHMKIIPSYTPPLPNEEYGAIVSTDPSGRIYLDRTFALKAPLETIAGCIEHELQVQARGVWTRLSFLSPEEWQKWAAVCVSLEVNSSMKEEEKKLPPEVIYDILSKSKVFPLSIAEKYGVKNAPSTARAGGFFPDEYGLKDGLTAEQYVRELLTTSSPKENEQETNSENDSQNNANTPDTPPDNFSEQNEENNDTQNMGVSFSPEGSNGENTDNNEDKNTPKSSQNTPSPLSSDENNSGTPNDDKNALESDLESNTGENNSSDNTPSEENNDNNTSDTPQDDFGTNPDGQSDQGNAPQGDGSEAPPDPSTLDSTQVQRDLSPKDMLLKQIQQGSPWSMSLPNPADPLISNPMKPNEKRIAEPVPPSEIEKAKLELEEDIVSIPMHYGASPGGRLHEWVEDRRRARCVDWGTVLTKRLTSCIQSSQTRGSSDMSYAVRNPNQPQFGPVLMGMQGYDPTVYVLVDISGSMLKNMAPVWVAFEDIVRTLSSRFNVKTTWMTGDVEIVDVGESVAPTKMDKARLHFGWGGTTLGTVIKNIMEGKLWFKGKRYKTPDVLLILTDCIFKWPETKPHGKTEVLIASVIKLEQLEENYGNALPSWINTQRDFVEVVA